MVIFLRLGRADNRVIVPVTLEKLMQAKHDDLRELADARLFKDV